MIFSKSYCPYCTATKNLFKQLGVEVVVLELDQIGNKTMMEGGWLQTCGIHVCCFVS